MNSETSQASVAGEPLVSILIPCFNAARWIAAAIESTSKQAGLSVEVVVVDDGSTDSSVDELRHFGNRIRWESQGRRGGNRTRNRLLELARGEWIQFLDADDYLLPGKVENQLASLKASGVEADVVYSPVRVETWRPDGSVSYSDSRVDADRTLCEQWIRWQASQTGSVLWRAEALRAIGGWNEEYSCCQDNEVVLRAIQNKLRFHFYPRAEAIYRIWSQETVCRRDPAKVIRVRAELTKAMLDWLHSRNQLTQQIREAAGEMFFEMSRMLAESDLNAAATLHDRARQDGLIRLSGPAAPPLYRLAYRILGFQGAEWLARLRRRDEIR